MSMERAEELRRLASKHKADIEMTLLVKVWDVLVSDERYAKMTDDEMDGDEAIQWLERRAWEKDHLKCQYNADFERNSIPSLVLDPHQQDLVTSLGADLGRVRNLRPNLIYGLEPSAFTDNEQKINHSLKSRLCLNLDHPFFVVEVKSGGAPIGDAENQAARAGCAMISLKRKYKQAAASSNDQQEHVLDRELNISNQAAQSSNAKEKSPAYSTAQPETTALRPPGYSNDSTTFTFSMALDPDLAKLFVNWSEEKFTGMSNQPSIFYQMNQTESYNLSKPAEWQDLHTAVDNIMDWGVGRHNRKLQEQCGKNMEFEANRTKKRRRS